MNNQFVSNFPIQDEYDQHIDMPKKDVQQYMILQENLTFGDSSCTRSKTQTSMIQQYNDQSRQNDHILIKSEQGNSDGKMINTNSSSYISNANEAFQQYDCNSPSDIMPNKQTGATNASGYLLTDGCNSSSLLNFHQYSVKPQISYNNMMNARNQTERFIQRVEQMKKDQSHLYAQANPAASGSSAMGRNH